MSIVSRLARYDDPNSLASRMRRKRSVRIRQLIEATYAEERECRILDIGGEARYWQLFEDDFLRQHGVAQSHRRICCDLSTNFPPFRSRVLGCRHAHRDGVSLFGRAAFLRPGRLRQRRRAQPGSRLAAGHRRSRRAAVLTQASTAAA